jgi:hypothetical protein
MALSHGRVGRVTAQNGGLRPAQSIEDHLQTFSYLFTKWEAGDLVQIHNQARAIKTEPLYRN